MAFEISYSNQFHNIHEIECYRAPKKFRDPSISSILILKNLSEILNIIKYITYELSIEINITDAFSYDCSIMNNQDTIYFKINIFEHIDDAHLLEFNLIQGERFTFGEILANIGTLIDVVIPGSLRLPKYDTDTDSNDLDLNYILENLNDALFHNQIHGMEMLSQVARDLSVSKIESIDINKWNELVELIFKIFENFEYENILVNIVYTLADIFSINISWNFDILEKGVYIAKYCFSYGYHTKRESMRLLCILSKKINIPKEHIMRLFGKDKFYNDKCAYNYSNELLN
jgi:hypothetical protein